MFKVMAGALREGGQGLIVANRKLPYEEDLKALGKVEVLKQAEGFKLFRLQSGGPVR